MVAAYTGNGAYCFSNALHMSLLAAGADPAALPEPWFVECLTTMPFGRWFSPSRTAFSICASGWNLERDALPLAIGALGWRCETRWGGDPDQVLERLCADLARGPAMLGPLDFGYLSYHRGAAGMAGFDHYVTALAMRDDGLLLHDPAGAPYAVLPLDDLVQAWRAEAIGWKLGPFTVRSRFEAVGEPTRAQMVERVLPSVRANVHRLVECDDRTFPHEALRGLAEALRAGPPGTLERQLVVFLLPTGTRRAVDAARFLTEAGLPTAAEAMGRAAELWGRSNTAAARCEWPKAAELLERAADAEQAMADALGA